ncbi:hypothetical protein NL108_017965 [Boleophthalmus pectinirostris]|nr:hypothetical protein NL108_017965 [Boleophthalmus pectinirostris]
MSIPSLRTKTLQRPQVVPKAVTGDYLDNLGTLSMNMRLGSEMFTHTVQVVRNVTQPVILGWDFLFAHFAVLDLKEGIFKVGTRARVPLLSATETAPLSCNAITVTPLLVPAMSQMTVLAKVQPTIGVPDLDTDYIGVIEPGPPSSQGLLSARTVAPVQAGMTYVRVMNPTTSDLQISSDTKLGDFYPLGQDNDYCIVETNVDAITTQIESTTQLLPDVNLNDSALTSDQKQKLQALLSSYCDVFSTHDQDYGRTDFVKHSIRTGDTPPIKQRAYRASPNIRAEIDRQVQQLLEQDIIEESYSPWSSPVVLVRKKDGTYRFCIDYRKLNAATIKDSYPLPRPAEALDSLSGSCWFSTMDLSSGYWQVELEPKDREKTAFNSGSGLYQFKVMPMGLTNAPPTFQRLMELVLHGLHWKECLIYLDDVLVFSRTFSDHLKSLGEVFDRFRTAGLKLKARKCHLAQTEVTFLGHVVSSRGLQPDEKNLEKVRKWPMPRTATEVRAFVGLCSYYRRFVKNFSIIAAPLHSLTHKGASFIWTIECEDAFQSLKHALTNPPVVAHPIFSQPFLLYTDASLEGIGSVLAQRQDSKEHVIAYASHTLTPSERKWSTFDRELFAVVWSVRHFKHFLSGSSFVVITDHKPLLSLKKTAVDNDSTGRRSRWILELDIYDYSIMHREGKQHANADALSRRPSTERLDHVVQGVTVAVTDTNTTVGPDTGDNLTQDFGNTLSIDSEQLKQQQQNDECLSTVISWVNDSACRPPIGKLRYSSPSLRKLWHEFPNLTLRQGILCRKSKQSPHSPVNFQVVLPNTLLPTALAALHGNQLSGHLNAERTLQRARRICYWPYMTRDVHAFCSECLPCQKRASPVPHERAPLQSIEADRPFQKVAADITELPITSQGNRYVLVITDYFTRYANLYPLKDQRAMTVAKCIFEDYVRQHGLPETIHTDQGRQFESDLVKHLCRLLGITKTRTTPYHAQSDGMVERLNRTLKDQLAKYIAQTGGEWDQFLPQVELAYNSSVHSSTGFSPFFLVHGREPNLPLDIILNCSPTVTSPTPGTPAAYASYLSSRLTHAFADAAHNSTISKLRQKSQYDKKVVFHPHEPGDLVLLDDPANKMNKLAPRWKGPFVILKRVTKDGQSGVIYEITDPKKAHSRTWIVHHNRLKAFKGALQDTGNKEKTFGPDSTPSLAPPLTALSGALPFRPPTPPHVPTRSRQPEIAPAVETTPQGAPPSPQVSVPSASPPSSPVSPPASPIAHPVVSRFGRRICRPHRYGDFVT